MVSHRLSFIRVPLINFNIDHPYKTRGVSLDIVQGGVEFPRKLDMGVLKFLGLKGCQIS